MSRKDVLRPVLVLLVGALLTTVLLAPALHVLLGSWLPALSFGRTFTRTLLVATLVLVVLQHRSLGVSKLAAMLREGTHRLRHLLLGVAIAAGVSLLALWGMVVAGDLQWRDDKAWLELLEKLVVVGGIAVVVALLEE